MKTGTHLEQQPVRRSMSTCSSAHQLFRSFRRLLFAPALCTMGPTFKVQSQFNQGKQVIYSTGRLNGAWGLRVEVVNTRSDGWASEMLQCRMTVVTATATVKVRRA